MNPTRNQAIRLPRAAVDAWRSLSVCGSRADRLDPAIVGLLVSHGAVILDAGEMGDMFIRRAECSVVAR